MPHLFIEALWAGEALASFTDSDSLDLRSEILFIVLLDCFFINNWCFHKQVFGDSEVTVHLPRDATGQRSHARFISGLHT